MSTLQKQIEQFRKMATDDPDNELGHFRLGQLLMEDEKPGEAVASFEKTIALAPNFSKAYQLLGECLIRTEQPTQALDVLTKGYKMAVERGDRMPAQAMEKLLLDLGAPVPTIQAPQDDAGEDTGFRCARPLCAAGKKAKPLAKPPLPDDVGQKLHQSICEQCWISWVKDYSVKVVNELRLDLSSETGQAEYDRYLHEYFGFNDA